MVVGAGVVILVVMVVMKIMMVVVVGSDRKVGKKHFSEKRNIMAKTLKSVTL